ncbi:MAG: HD domain-containing protein [Candidatus Brocadiaceae bacterium]|jgi:putative nucleotidyltransferase with HDIG domain
MTPLKCPGQDPRFMKASDVAETSCPGCGQRVEFWPDELLRKCPGCGSRLANPNNALKCLEWCEHAAECLEAIRDADGGLAPLRDELIERVSAAFDDDQSRIEHTLSVLELATEIGRRVGANPFVLLPAAILHDVGRAAPNGGSGREDHQESGRRLASELLERLNLPEAIQQEIVQLVGHHHERDEMNTTNGAPLFDADLIVNLKSNATDGWERRLQEKALTEPGLELGRERLSEAATGER